MNHHRSKFAALALTAAMTAGAAHAATVSVFSATPNVQIPNGSSGVYSDINVNNNGGTVGSLTVSVGLNHQYLGDLIVRLTHGANTATLMDRPGRPANASAFSNAGDSSNLSSNYPLLFSMAGLVDAEDIGAGNCQNSDTVGQSTRCSNSTFRPDGLLNDAFAGSALAGLWRLTVIDRAEHEDESSGRLVNWSLNVTPQAVTPTVLNLQATAVPEPGTLALLALSLAGVAAARRRAR